MPLLEEVSDAEDIDNMDMDLAEFDPNLRTPFAPKLEKTIVRSQDLEEQEQKQKILPDREVRDDLMDLDMNRGIPSELLETVKTLQVLYPCYFDKNRSRQQGRRISKELAVENPLAQTIVEACASLHLICTIEPSKTHPQDWGNPGRVRVLIKEDGKPQSVFADNKRHLMNQVAKYLQSHPTTLESVKKPVGVPELKNVEPQLVPKPKNLKMNTIVPLYSTLTMAADPGAKSLYEPEPEVPQVQAPKVPKQKNKFMHVRR
jgi:signal recognition particle subunit SRP19